MAILPGALPEAVLILGMTPENYNFGMGLSGVVAALLVGLIWSRGL